MSQQGMICNVIFKPIFIYFRANSSNQFADFIYRYKTVRVCVLECTADHIHIQKDVKDLSVRRHI